MTKNMHEVFQPLNIKLELNGDRPYLEVDGAKTYLFTPGGRVTQSIYEALLQLKVERNKYKKGFEKLKEHLLAGMEAGKAPQSGNRTVELDERTTTSNQHKDVLEHLVREVLKYGDEQVAEVMEKAVKKNKKKAIKIDGTFV